MKWASKNTFSVYSYAIDIERMISPVYHLILDLLRNKRHDRPFDKWIGEIFNMSLLAGYNQKYDTEESFLVTISDYLEDCLYEKVCCLEKCGILLVYRTKLIFIAPANTRMLPELIKWIKESKVMDRFLDLVNNSENSNVKETLSKFMNEQYFGNYVQVKESELKGTFIPKKFVKDYTEQPIDEKSIWISRECKAKLEVRESTQCSDVSFPGIDGSCIAVGELVLTTEYVGHLIKPKYSTEYFWTMLNNVYAHKNSRINKYRDKCSEFTKALKNPKLANLMTKLQYNLYLFKTDMEGHEEFKKFFEEVYNIEQFKDETNHIIFTGSHVAEQVENKQTMFGLYKTEKDDTEFNLRAWINVETADSQKITKSNGTNIVKIKTVYALKPHSSYYFCKDSLEDTVADMLKKSGITSLSNFMLFKSDAPDKSFIEIDQMIKKADESLVYIETKTTLNKFNIEETVNKVTGFHQIMATSYPDVQIKYMLVSPYYNDTVEEAFSYFTQEAGSSVHDFKIPIVRYPGIELHCIVEPEYDRLKIKMEQLLK